MMTGSVDKGDVNRSVFRETYREKSIKSRSGRNLRFECFRPKFECNLQTANPDTRARSPLTHYKRIVSLLQATCPAWPRLALAATCTMPATLAGFRRAEYWLRPLVLFLRWGGNHQTRSAGSCIAVFFVFFAFRY